jgi:hypothetical protein
MHPYMTEQLAVLRQRQLLEEAEANRMPGRRPSWLRARLSTLRRTLVRERKPAPATAPTRAPKRVDEAVVAG